MKTHYERKLFTCGNKEAECKAPYQRDDGVQTSVNRDVTDSLCWQRIIIDADSVVNYLTDDKLKQQNGLLKV